MKVKSFIIVFLLIIIFFFSYKVVTLKKLAYSYEGGFNRNINYVIDFKEIKWKDMPKVNLDLSIGKASYRFIHLFNMDTIGLMPVDNENDLLSYAHFGTQMQYIYGNQQLWIRRNIQTHKMETTDLPSLTQRALILDSLSILVKYYDFTKNVSVLEILNTNGKIVKSYPNVIVETNDGGLASDCTLLKVGKSFF